MESRSQSPAPGGFMAPGERGRGARERTGSPTAVMRRGVRAVEGARLESVYTGNRIVGSNPTLSAMERGGPSPVSEGGA